MSEANLQERVQCLLAKLAKLSEAQATAAFDARSGHTAADSKEPPGVKPWRPKRPDPDENLMDWYVWRLQEAGDSEPLILAATIEAEIRLSKRTHKPPDTMRAGSALMEATESSATRDKRIAEGYEGLTPEEVSIIETHRAGYVRPANIRRVRRNFKRNPETGIANPDAVAPEQIHDAAREMKQAAPHLSIRQIAMRLDTSKSTVARALEEMDEAA